MKSDERVLLLGSDIDSLVSALLVFYLMENKHSPFTYSSASTLVKERRLSMNIAGIFHTHLKFKQLKLEKEKPPLRQSTLESLGNMKT